MARDRRADASRGPYPVSRSRAVVMQDLALNDGSGGLIAVEAQGNITVPFNSPGMYRGMVRSGESLHTEIFGGAAAKG